MKKMLAGIFLALLSIWAVIFAVYSNHTMFEYLAVFLPILAVVLFILGYFEIKN